MTEYFYTVDLGKIYGPKLQALAVRYCRDDVEEFAAVLLCEAVDYVEKLCQIEDAEINELIDSGSFREPETQGDEDDDIPF